MPVKRGLGINVLEAAKQRIAWVFDTFPRVYVSFSGGKDSTVMLHLVMQEAIRRQRKVGVLIVDLEAQYKLTIEHIQHVVDKYRWHIDLYWVCLPIALRNAVSNFEPKWICWQPTRQQDWVRQPPRDAITDLEYFDFYWYREGRDGKPSSAMEFEDFVPLFGDWYSQGMPTACFVGIRTGESLNRWRTIAGHGTKFEGRKYTNHVMKTVWNVYPIYDWTTEDIWTFHAKTKLPYNKLYDRMYQAGLSVHQMRICQPYGDDQRKGLWLFHVVEPETWGKIVARVNGANFGALYARETGNILGRIRITKPEGHTWESFANFLLATMPPATAEHYKNKIAVFIKWWMDAGYPDGIPDEADPKLEKQKKAPSWRRVAYTLLRNDYHCKSLGFSAQKGTRNEQYKTLMTKRRNQWGIYPLSND